MRRLALLLACAALWTAPPARAAEGRFGAALDPRRVEARAPGRAEYARAPITVECWAKLDNPARFNILVASHPKSSGNHWEIYSYAGSGLFSAYLPGYAPAELKSPTVITDGRWHYLAMTFDGRRVQLFADGRRVLQQAVRRLADAKAQPGPLSFGSIPHTELGCDGVLDEVRISSTIRTINGLPKGPFQPDARTIGLWHMDRIENGRIADASQTANPIEASLIETISLDELDYRSYHAGPSPMSRPATEITLSPGAAEHPQGAPVLSLDGDWQMARDGDEAARLSGDWTDAIPATVPGSVHLALQKAGIVPDPKFGLNDRIAHEKSFHTWWMKRTFAMPAGMRRPRLIFDGVAIRCTIYLNGRKLGSHDGMFGGPEFEDVSPWLKQQNTLIVRLDPAPGDPKAWNNPAWRQTVVFNNVWGWHYSSIPAIGIWRSVWIRSTPPVALDHPFIATRDAGPGVMDLAVDLAGAGAGRLIGTIEPDTFTGPAFHFERPVAAGAGRTLRLSFTIPDARQWWPNGLGQPDLYRLRLSFVPADGGRPDTWKGAFGIRTITMSPLPGGPYRNRFNWTFVINGRPTFIKGTGWCTMDSSMDFSRRRYDRFLSLAQQAHMQMVRGWGSGMPETDDFYDLCDRKGILVLQEWPTAWDSHLVQPYDVLESTVRLNTLRLRNHPSLAMWGGGNESGNPYGKAIDMMGRLYLELDGTRSFHRGEPFGGSQHNYDCYWGRQPLDHNLNMTAPFWGEFGLASMPVYESVLRYLPEPEQKQWPPAPDGSLVHHTPIFNTADDFSRLSQYAGYFSALPDLKRFLVASQLAQAVGLRHTLERARTCWPDCTGALFYKLNDNYPAASWSVVDWYGAPKLSYWFVRDAFAPLAAPVIFDSVNNQGRALSLPVFLLDDAGRLKSAAWEVRIRAFDGSLKLIHEQRFAGAGSTESVKRLGQFALTADQTRATPLLVVSEVHAAGQLAQRTFYFVNYEPRKDCLFNLPRTTLKLALRDQKAIVTNTGNRPAVAACITRPGHADTFTASDGAFWLDPGEQRVVSVSDTAGVAVEAWNAEGVMVEGSMP